MSRVPGPVSRYPPGFDPVRIEENWSYEKFKERIMRDLTVGMCRVWRLHKALQSAARGPSRGFEVQEGERDTTLG